MPTLVIVDDEPNVRYSLEKGLRRESLHVLSAATAKDGLALIRRERPDVVLMDVRLPDMSGLDAFDQVKQYDARLPVITNHDLPTLVNTGDFRLDLFYRLNVFTINMPALRDRADDIQRLAEHFIRQLNQTLKKDVQRIAPDALSLLRAHRWPGNVRELQNVLKYALVHASGQTLTAECLPQSLRSAVSDLAPAETDPNSFDLVRFIRRLLAVGETGVYHRVQTEMDHRLLRVVLDHVAGNQVQASELLGISRTTLRAKPAALGTDTTPESSPN